MQFTRNIFYYALCTFLAMALTMTVSVYIVYRHTLDQDITHMQEQLQQQVTLINSAAKYAMKLNAGQIDSVSLRNEFIANLDTAYQQIPGFGETGEIIIGRMVTNGIRIVMRTTAPNSPAQTPTNENVQNFKPMRLALEQFSGTLRTKGLNGQDVTSVYDYIPSLGIGLVASLDMQELQIRFFRIYLIALMISLSVAALSTKIVERIENRLHLESEKAKNALLTAQHSAGIGYIEYDLTKQKLKFSEEAALIFNKTAYMHLQNQEPITESAHPVDKPLVSELFSSGKKSKNQFNFKYQLVLSDETVRWIHLIAEYRKNPAGKRTVLFMTVRDITEEKHAELELEKSMRELNNYKSALDGFAIVAITDRTGRMMHVNDMFCKMTGFSREELIGQNHRLLNSGHHTKDFFINLWQTVSRGEIWKGDIKNKKKSGETHWVATTIVPFTNHDNKIDRFISIRTDVTEKKEREASLRHHTKALIQKNKELIKSNSTKNDFLCQVSHEIRQPLRVINQYVDELESEASQLDSSHRNRCLRTIKSKFDALERLMDDLLDVQKIDAGQSHIFRTELDLVPLLAEMHTEYLQQCEKNDIEFVLDVPKSPVSVLADEKKIIHVVHNLIDNAIAYTPSGTVKLSLTLDNSGATVSISDTGIGIDSAYHNSIFERFTQLTKEGEQVTSGGCKVNAEFGKENTWGRKGTGLGLSISQSLMKFHESHITVDSELGKGSTFGFKLPHYDPTTGVLALIADTATSAKRPLSDVHVGIIQIMLPRVVDHSKLQKALGAVLREGQDRVITVPSANLICAAAITPAQGYSKLYRRLLVAVENCLDESLALVEYDGAAGTTTQRLTEQYVSVEMMLNDLGSPVT